METNQIIENNKLIAKFMNYANGRRLTDDLLKTLYNDWNSLMPVVEKCKERQIFGSQGLINNIDKRLLQVDLLATYGNVISFIEFYNIKSI